MSKKKGKNDEPETGDEFIALAERRGAVVKRVGNFFKVKTTKGSMKIAPGHTKLDKTTISNTEKWFRLLGLMAVLFFCIFPLLSRIGIL